MTTRVAVAGAGFFAQFHLEAWRRMADVEVVGLADRNPAARAAWDVPGFDSLEAMLAEVDADILDIALPPVAHFDAIQAATRAGIPAILCQKPFCGGLEGARAAVAHIQGTASRVIVHENFRFQPWYRAAGQVIAEGPLGHGTANVVSAQAR